MNRLLILALASTAVGIGKLAVSTEYLVDPPVNLQAATPGTAQVGNANITGTLIAGTIFGTSAGVSSKVVSGWATSTTGFNFGGDFRTASVNGRGVFASATATTGTCYGGDFRSASTTGRGIFGWATATSGASIGAEFRSDSTSGRGVYGWTNATSGNTYGGEFMSNSTTGRGVYGHTTATTGSNYGGYFASPSPTGAGVFGFGTAGTGGTTGGLFEAGSTQAYGLYSWAYASTGLTYGVFGRADSPDGYAVWAQGRTGASGTKSFRIDHPLDPENKYLMHYSTESPQPQNFYNGIVTTDAKGEAWVDLPAYYSEINVSPRYTLTVVDDTDSATFVQVKVAREIRANRFKIRSSAPRTKVSWRVDAVRNDLWVRRYGAPTEVVKDENDRGKYTHPELYGAAPEQGIGYRPDPRESEAQAPK